MGEVIRWCNDNNGFLTGVLSLLTLVVSVIAVVVSIQTARLPYKKKAILSSSFLYGMVTEPFASKPVALGLEAGITNLGNRAIHITYLGYAVKKDKKYYRMYPINRTIECKKTIMPTEIMTVSFMTDELIKGLSNEPTDAKLFVYAVDSENKEYIRKTGSVGKLLENLCKAR